MWISEPFPPVRSFPIEAQLEDVNGDLSATETVTVSVPGVVTAVAPELTSIWLIGALLAALAAGGRRREARAVAVGVLTLSVAPMVFAQSGPRLSSISTNADFRSRWRQVRCLLTVDEFRDCRGIERSGDVGNAEWSAISQPRPSVPGHRHITHPHSSSLWICNLPQQALRPGASTY